MFLTFIFMFSEMIHPLMKDLTLMIYEQIRALKRVAVDMKLSDSDVEAIMNSNAKKLIEEAGR